MPLRSWTAANPRAILICRILGLCIFVAAFLLPACKSLVFGTSFVRVTGWECAEIASSLPFEKDTYQSDGFLAAMSGLINPFILFYLSFSFTPKFVIVRRTLAAAILVCMVATWIFFAMEGFVPLVGHFLWIAGAILILLPEVIRRQRGQREDDEKVPPHP